MIAVDTNILVYAHREDHPWHDAARATFEGLLKGDFAWAIPWPSIHEFLAIVTHPRIFDPPTPRELALDAVSAWLDAETVVVLAEGDEHFSTLRRLIETARIAGPRIHDARIAALCIDHGVRELWSADRDFHRFPSLRVRNPLLG